MQGGPECSFPPTRYAQAFNARMSNAYTEYGVVYIHTVEIRRSRHVSLRHEALLWKLRPMGTRQLLMTQQAQGCTTCHNTSDTWVKQGFLRE